MNTTGFAHKVILENVMPTVDLDLQLKFLNELETALADALSRYSDDGEDKLAELTYMQNEVKRAKRVIAERMDTDEKPRRQYRQAAYQEVAFS